MHHYLCSTCLSWTACSDFLQPKMKRPPPFGIHYFQLESSFSLAAFLPNHRPTSHQPDTRPPEPEPLCCWMKQRGCWRTEAVRRPGDGFWRCLSCGWRCGTPLVRTQKTRGSPWGFLGSNWGGPQAPCFEPRPFDSGLLGKLVWAGQDGGDWPDHQSHCPLSCCC